MLMKTEQKNEGTLVLLRHGESVWNKANLFTGWVDVPLSPKGIEEALIAGENLKEINFDVVFCSALSRSITTALLALSKSKSTKTPVIQHLQGKMKSWATIYSEKTEASVLPVHIREELNERMYGELQGLNKKETAEKYGAEQVLIWRRSYRTAPPQGESLEMTLQRTLPCFSNEIEPLVKQGKTLLISAHGNSLRAIIKHIEGISEEEILKRELETGIPLIYKYKDRYTYCS